MDLISILDDAFCRLGYVTSRKLQHALGVSRQAVWLRMRPLVDAGIVTVEGNGRGVRYLRGERPVHVYRAPRTERFWLSLENRFPKLAWVPIRNGLGTRLRRHAVDLLFPPTLEVDFVLLDFDGVDRVWPAFARACMVELPSFSVHVQPINASPQILATLEQAIRCDELRPGSDLD